MNEIIDQKFIFQLEERIKRSWEGKQLSQIENFPFNNYDDFVNAYQKNEISIGVDYKGDLLNVFGTRSEINIHLFYSWLPFIIVLIDAILAISYSWLTLIGIPLAIIGWLLSSPYVAARQSIAGFSMLFLIISFFLFDWSIIIIIGSFFLSISFAMATREHFQNTIIERVLSSEVVLAYLYSMKLIYIRLDKRT